MAAELEEYTNALHEAIAPLLQYQPKNPLVHLCSHFKERAYGCDPVIGAYRQIRLAGIDDQTFPDQLYLAYTKLAGVKPCLDGEPYLQLLSMLCGSLNTAVAEALQKVFQDLSSAAPSFAIFRASIRTCLLLEQLASKSPAQPLSDTSKCFLVAEAKQTIIELLLEQEWVHACSPQEDVVQLRSLHVPVSGRPVDALVAYEEIQGRTEQLVQLAAQMSTS